LAQKYIWHEIPRNQRPLNICANEKDHQIFSGNCMLLDISACVCATARDYCRAICYVWILYLNTCFLANVGKHYDKWYTVSVSRLKTAGELKIALAGSTRRAMHDRFQHWQTWLYPPATK